MNRERVVGACDAIAAAVVATLMFGPLKWYQVFGCLGAVVACHLTKYLYVRIRDRRHDGWILP